MAQLGCYRSAAAPVRGRLATSVLALAGAIAVFSASVSPSAAVAAGRAAYSSPGYRGTTKAAADHVLRRLPTPIALSASGHAPDVLVDGAGTSHIVWITSDGVNADAIHYCRLRRGASACDGSRCSCRRRTTATATARRSTARDGARIVQVGQQIVILDYRYPTFRSLAAKPDDSSGSNTVLEWVSEDGGNELHRARRSSATVDQRWRRRVRLRPTTRRF